MTYAEYARQGFFELLWAIGLCLPVLLVLHQTMDATDSGTVQIYRVLAGVLVALLGVVMASAVMRMRLYVASYGLTELRLYSTAAMAWFALVFLWFAVTVLSGRRQRFAIGAFASGFLVLGGVCLLNPDVLIARTNLALAQQAHPLDACYASGLSGDAVATLVAGIDRTPASVRGPLAYLLLAQWSAPPSDFRSWNFGWYAAWDAVSRHHAALVADAASVKANPCESDTD